MDFKVICEIGDASQPPGHFRQVLVVRVSGRIATIYNYGESDSRSERIYLESPDARKLGEALIAFADECDTEVEVSKPKPKKGRNP